MKQQQLRYLIQRHRTGEATKEERDQLERYWQESLEDDNIFQSLTSGQKDDLEQSLWEGTLQQIQQQEPGAFKPVVALNRQRRWWMVAASLSAVFVLFAAGWFWTSTHPAGVSYKTGYGQRQRVVLPEGSVAWLNGNSAIRFNTTGNGDREVWLKGEALFTVKHTADDRKFLVHTQEDLTIEVLGTVFNVFDRRGQVSVVLREGAVKVVDETQQQPAMLMKPGEKISTRKGGRELQKNQVLADLATAWTTGTMQVENKPLGEIFDWLEDTYGIEVNAPERIRRETFAGSVPTDSLSHFFDKLEKIYSVQVEQRESKYKIL